MRAKEPAGQGPWPSIWLLGSNCQASNIIDANNVPPCHWPDPGSDEIDIAEFLGSDYTSVNQQLHRTGSGDPGCHPSLTDASQNWHVYSLVWEVGRLQWLIDGSVTCTVQLGRTSRRA